MSSAQNRFPLQERRKRWIGCWGGFSCFKTQKGRKRIAPARVPEGNGSTTQQNGPQAAGLPNQATSLAPSLLAPPSSPASFTNSAIPSTVQSPSCFMSANSPGGPSNTMFAPGPYAHEPQLVSPPVFSTFTTEPSTAPLTPPPELAHLTTPSSPDVPFAQYLSSSADLKGTNKTNYLGANDLHATYSLYPGSPASTLRSPITRTSGDGLSSSFPEREFQPHWDPSVSPQNGKYLRSASGRLFGFDTDSGSMMTQDSNFFCPETFAQFYLDNDPPFPHGGGRLSVSKDSDAYSTGGSGYQNRHNKNTKQDADEIEAYRASFGFSADDIITTPQYVEISDVLEDSFSILPLSTNELPVEHRIETSSPRKGQNTKSKFPSQKSLNLELDRDDSACPATPASRNHYEDHKSRDKPAPTKGSSTPGNHSMTDDEDIRSQTWSSKTHRKYQLGLSSSDAEIDYRRTRSLRKGKGDFAWHD